MIARTESRRRRAAALFGALLAVACSGSSQEVGGPPTLSSVTLVAPSPAYVLGSRQVRVGVVAHFSDGSNVNVTGSATLSSTDTGAIQVSDGKLEKGATAAAGQYADVTASFGGKTSAPVRVEWANAVAVGPGHSTDPLVPQQWHLYNIGQTGFAQTAATADWDIHAVGYAYAHGYTGRGVKVAVVDSGLEIGHEDFWAVPGDHAQGGNIAQGSWNFTSGTIDPTTTSTAGDHGTSVAGLIAAYDGNGVGGMGVAPLASLNGYNLLDQDANQTLGNFVAALGAGHGVNGPKADDVWVFNQSFAQAENAAPNPLNATIEAQYWDGVRNLRGGLGAIYVKSAGNGFEPSSGSCDSSVTCVNASMDPFNTLPPNIVVAAVNSDGIKSSYSTAGSAIWVANFGGEYGYNGCTCNGAPCPANAYKPAMVSTDQSTCAAGYSPQGAASAVRSGFNRGGASNGGIGYFDAYLGATVNGSCNYRNTMNGTSSAAPVTSGVVALMLEANPSLTWRDVKHLLASTARKIDAARPEVALALTGGSYIVEPAWITNAAGFDFHNWYGFGLVDASEAVHAAEDFTPGYLGTMQDTGWFNGAVTSAAIPDASAMGATGAVAVSSGLTIEAVQVHVTTNHSYLGDLGVELVSPSGTRSVLLNALNSFRTNIGTVTVQLASNAFYGEPSAGTWRLKVVDASAVDTGSLLGWQMRIIGH